MRILVIGGSGFIGRNFLLKIDKEWECFATHYSSIGFLKFIENNKLDNVQQVFINLLNKDDIEIFIDNFGNEFDICLFAAGNSDIGKSCQKPQEDLYSNVYALLNLLNFIYVKKFIFISSGAVYEGYKGLINPLLPVNPTIPYAISKLTSERYIEYFQKHTDHIDNYVCLRFFGAYGPMELSRKIYTNLIKTFCIEQKDEYTIFGDGKNYIDAMYIDDLIECLLKIIKSDKGNKILDLCYGSPLTINELVEKTAEIFSKKIVIKHEKNSAEYTTFYASPLEIESLFGFRPKIALCDGLKKFKEYLICQN